MIDSWKIMKPVANATAEPTVAGRYVLATGRAAAGRLACLHSIYGPGTRQLLELAGLRPGMRVADLGCGVGTVTQLLAEMVGPDGHVVGVDLSADQLEQARRRMESVGLTNTTFSDTDFGVTGILLGNMAHFMDKGTITMIITGIFGLLVIYNFTAKKKTPVETNAG